jgi:hypothetical protein
MTGGSLFLAKAQRRKGLFVIAKPRQVFKLLLTCVAEAISATELCKFQIASAHRFILGATARCASQ